jgi:hypothetical protein
LIYPPATLPFLISTFLMSKLYRPGQGLFLSQSNGILVGCVIGSSEYVKGTPASPLPRLLDVILI